MMKRFRIILLFVPFLLFSCTETRTVWLDELDLTLADQATGVTRANQSMWRTPLVVAADTFKRDYNWSHYVADPKFSRLEVRFIESLPDKKAKKDASSRREGRIWGTVLNKTYVTPKEADRYEKQYAPHDTKENRR